MKSLSKAVLIIVLANFIYSCGTTKRILPGNYIFTYKDNNLERTIHDNDSILDIYYVFKVDSSLKSEIEDKTDFLIIKNNAALAHQKPIDSLMVSPPSAPRIQLNGSYYSHESSQSYFDKYKQSLKYIDVKFALQTLTIPLKFRRQIDDGTTSPQQVETGINIGFAPVLKYNLNIYDPLNKIMGKSLNQYAINTGVLLNIGATDLKGATNAPGLVPDRRAPMFTYGTFIMVGVNNINFGYAIGWDRIIGEGRNNWIYHDKMWHGVIIALDIIKP